MKVITGKKLSKFSLNHYDIVVCLSLLCCADQKFVNDFSNAEANSFPIAVQGIFYNVKDSQESISGNEIILMLNKKEN